MRKALLMAGAALALLAAGCREEGKEPYAIAGKLFVFNYRLATATFLVRLKPLRPMAEGQHAVAHFQDPAGGAPIEVEERIWPALGKVTLESPPVRCIYKDVPYSVTIRIVDEAGATVQTIETRMMSTEDQSILPDKPLVVGSLYQPNPELAGNPGGKVWPPMDGCPPRPANAPAQR